MLELSAICRSEPFSRVEHASQEDKIILILKFFPSAQGFLFTVCPRLVKTGWFEGSSLCEPYP